MDYRAIWVCFGRSIKSPEGVRNPPAPRETPLVAPILARIDKACGGSRLPNCCGRVNIPSGSKEWHSAVPEYPGSRLRNPLPQVRGYAVRVRCAWPAARAGRIPTAPVGTRKTPGFGEFAKSRRRFAGSVGVGLRTPTTTAMGSGWGSWPHPNPVCSVPQLPSGTRTDEEVAGCWVAAPSDPTEAWRPRHIARRGQLIVYGQSFTTLTTSCPSNWAPVFSWPMTLTV